LIVDTVRLYYKKGDTIPIVSLSDLHEGHINQDSKALARILKRKGCYFIVNGDVHDAIVLSDRRYQKGMDKTVGEAILDEQLDAIEAKLKPVRTRTLWIHKGNHDETIIKKCGTDLVDRLCKRLSTTNHRVIYAGYSSLMRLILRVAYPDGTFGASRTIMFRCHHGWGGGCRTIGSVITKYSHDLKYWDADIYVYGHDHALHAVPIPRGTAIGNKLYAKDKHIILSGTYLRTYTRTTDASWHEVKGFPLTKIGSPTINIRPEGNKWCHIWVDA
jgi:hypothetical protein